MGAIPKPPDTADDVLCRRLVERHPDGVAVWDGTAIRYANAAFDSLLGHAGHAPPTTLESLFAPPDREAIRAALREVLENGATLPPITARLQRRDDAVAAPIEVELGLYPIRVDGGTAAAAVLRDVTARSRAEERLRISENSYRQLFDGAPEAIYVQDENGVFLDVNQRAVEMYGREKAYFIGRTPLALSAPGRNDLQAVAELLPKVFAGETHRFEFWGLRSDGSEFPKEVMVTPGTYFGKPVVVAFARDITERRALEERLLHSEKLEAVGRLAGGVAHDFNNILQAITSHVDLALSHPDDAASARRHLESVRDASDRAGALIRQLLAFARRQELEKELIDLNEVVIGLYEMLRRLVRESIHIGLEPFPEPLVVFADAGQLEQVLMNLVVNASDAIDGAGTITIRTSRHAADDAFRASRPWATADTHATLSVSDTGCGIRDEVRDAMFEPFVTTKAHGKGTGLGLSMVHGIVSQHGGGIDVQTGDDGCGTTFAIHLPATDAKASPRARARHAAAPRGRGEGRILLAEDDAAVRAVVQESLRSAGYDVVAAVGGREAIEIFERSPGEVDLAVLDVVMDGTDGREVFSRLRDLRPDLPVLFSTGYDEASVLEGIPRGRGIRMLLKPYPVGELLDTVRTLLRERTYPA